jgi:hypothetical protein
MKYYMTVKNNKLVSFGCTTGSLPDEKIVLINEMEYKLLLISNGHVYEIFEQLSILNDKINYSERGY